MYKFVELYYQANMRDILYDLYIEDNMPIRKLATHFCVSVKTMQRILEEFNIKKGSCIVAKNDN